ncbi:hypothetical protein HD806DRAFT_532235 [Xylariaceae sp. AK1471]|nr:hypothetical protein HD806DRAFT_532235 [Xylariaceae sp. AK1471]
MNFQTNLRAGFDEDPSFSYQNLSCNQLPDSFSWASMASYCQDLFTPTSGFSTAGLEPMLMEHTTMACGSPASFELTPSASTFNNSFQPDTKAELPHYTGSEKLLATPNQKTSPQASIIDFSSTPMICIPTASQSYSVQSTNPQGLDYHDSTDQIAAPSLNSPPHSYSLENSTYSRALSWTQPGSSLESVLERRDASGPTISLQDTFLRERPIIPLPYFPTLDTRPLSVNGAQQKTTALYRVQRGHRVSKQNRAQETTTARGKMKIIRFTKDFHCCPHEDCGGQKRFKQKVHLKRHLTIAHGDRDIVYTKCQYCEKKFNRKDNWRAHLIRHTRPGGRTQYFKGAQSVLDKERQTIKKRS